MLPVLTCPTNNDFHYLYIKCFIDVLEADVIEELPLTSGDWEVISKQVL